MNNSDENVKIVNGVNATFWVKKFKNQNAVVNGISVGVIPVPGKSLTARRNSLRVLGIFGSLSIYLKCERNCCMCLTGVIMMIKINQDVCEGCGICGHVCPRHIPVTITEILVTTSLSEN